MNEIEKRFEKEILDSKVSSDHPLLSKMDEVFSEQQTINELYETWLSAAQKGLINLTTDFGEYLEKADRMLDERLDEFKEMKVNDGRIVNKLLDLAESGDYIPAYGRVDRVPVEVIEMQEMLIKKTKEVIVKYKRGTLEPKN